ncbi:MAG: hypothetical protein RLZZ543_1512 [Bacteroidota bacterium]|jgi:hypothetical protein
MENRNWLSIVKNLLDASNAEELKELILDDDFNSFQSFTGLDFIQTLVLGRICATTNRVKPIKSLDVFRYCSASFSNQEVQNAFEYLVSHGWIFSSPRESYGKDEFVCLAPMVEFGLRTGAQNKLPQERIGQTSNWIRTLASKAASFRRSFICKYEWIAFCSLIKQEQPFKTALEISNVSNLDDESTALLFALTGLHIYDNYDTNADSIFALFCNDQIDRFNWTQKNLTAESPLISNELITYNRVHGIDHSFGIGKQWMSSLIPNYVPAETVSSKSDLIKPISPHVIDFQELIFNKSIDTEIESMVRILQPDAFRNYSKRMNEMGFNKGFAGILFGPPGSGKTELCKQIAKRTSRKLFLFEVASARNKFYGETEKNIKQVFDHYRSVSQSEELAPILLFNEADSIFSKRNSGGSVVTQVENVIQTILLNELEKFDGILLATTNRFESFDPAFSRRFLYKIGILNPDEESRFRLISNVFPSLNHATCEELSNEYEFNGADLSNVFKKIEIQRLISETINLEQTIIDELTMLSKAKKKRNRIGFI